MGVCEGARVEGCKGATIEQQESTNLSLELRDIPLQPAAPGTAPRLFPPLLLLPAQLLQLQDPLLEPRLLLAAGIALGLHLDRTGSRGWKISIYGAQETSGAREEVSRRGGEH